LLGVKAVFSRVFEPIHRANLVGMGVLLMNFVEGDRAAALASTARKPSTSPGSTRAGQN
jgi:aconitate hydratase